MKYLGSGAKPLTRHPWSTGAERAGAARGDGCRGAGVQPAESVAMALPDRLGTSPQWDLGTGGGSGTQQRSCIGASRCPAHLDPGDASLVAHSFRIWSAMLSTDR